MVVDDEPDITTVVKRGLESQGFVVDAFNKPEDALANFKPGVYDMLITDIRMPVMTGFDLYREIRKNDNKIKVAFMTAFEIYENEFRKMFKDIDVKSFFKKPISISNLAARINEELGKKQTLYGKS
jgi:two-component system catabolic regulation response regulator CreB/two-component system response regulator ChvI